jgi:hypothetical protein
VVTWAGCWDAVEDDDMENQGKDISSLKLGWYSLTRYFSPFLSFGVLGLDCFHTIIPPATSTLPRKAALEDTQCSSTLTGVQKGYPPPSVRWFFQRTKPPCHVWRHRRVYMMFSFYCPGFQMRYSSSAARHPSIYSRMWCRNG